MALLTPELRRNPGLQAILDELKQDTHAPEWSMRDLELWMLDDREQAPRTVKDRLRHVRFMESYAGQPVMMHGTRYQFLVSARLFIEVRKDEFKRAAAATGNPMVGAGAIKKDIKVLKSVGRFLGVPDRGTWPVAPQQFTPEPEVMPTPEQVYELLHTAWTPNPHRSLENQWLRHVLALMFGLGPRPPKEVWFMRRDAYNAKTGILRIVEPKKHHRVRLVYVEPKWLAQGTKRPSIESWLRHRARYAPDSTAMFPNPVTGKDFPSPEAFTQFLVGRVKPRFPWFHGYIARHWCAYARIIEGGFADSNFNAVCEQLGHDSVDMTRGTYAPGAKTYSKSPAYGTNWMSRAFAKPRQQGPQGTK